MRMWIGIVGIVVLLAAFPAALAQAPDPGGPRPEGPPRVGAEAAVPQPPEPGGPRPEGPPRPGEAGTDRDIRGLVESIMAARLAEELGLNDEQTVLMIRRLSEFRKEMNERKKQRSELLKELRTVLQEGKPDEEITAKLDGLLKYDKESVEFKRGIYEKACEGLAVAQRAKMYVFLDQFEADMRKLIEKARATRTERGRRPDFFDPRRPPDMPQPPAGLPGDAAGRPDIPGRPPMPGMEGRMPGQRPPRAQGGSPNGQQPPPPGGPPEGAQAPAPEGPPKGATP